MKILKDIYNYYNFKKRERNIDVGFFCESKFIFNYLEPYVLKKSKKKAVIILSFEKLNLIKNDKIFLFTFYTKFFRQLIFLTLKLKYLYSSTPDLNHSIFVKSKLSNCKYIYLQHSPVSLTMIYNAKAFDDFDAVQTINNYQFYEMNEIKQKKGLNTKIFKSKYLFLHKKISSYKKQDNNFDVLIAPTWRSAFYQSNCHIILNNLLKKSDITYVLRPHPMSFKKNEITLEDLKKHNIPCELSKEIDFNKYNFLISDWSGIFIEFAMITKRKAYLVNTPKKVLNDDYSDYKNIPIEISLRNILGKTFEVSELDRIVEDLMKNKKNNTNIVEDENIKKCIKDNFYY